MLPEPVIYIGFDPRPPEVQGFAVTRNSIRRYLTQPLPIRGIVLAQLQAAGLYYRPTTRRNGVLWDTISNAPMATEFAISRFLTPYLAKSGLAMFLDADMMARDNFCKLFREIDRTKVCSVVKHDFKPTYTVKMDNQTQTQYERKNWSSVVVWNCDHPKAQYLTPARVNAMRGLELHQFSWLDDSEIGELDPKWNYLVGHSDPAVDPSIVHFTDGLPSMAGYEDCEYADDWWFNLRTWAS